ncbi:hypothetical protein Tco_1023770 [Tanacetum coccineum]
MFQTFQMEEQMRQREEVTLMRYSLPRNIQRRIITWKLSAKLARVDTDKGSGEADTSKDTSGPESPEELQRSWYVEGQIRSGVISPVLAQQYQKTIRQRYSPYLGPLSLEWHKDESRVDSQLVEEEVRGLEPGDVGTKTQKGPTGPVSQTQTTLSPSPTFVKENIDALRTMIKEYDRQTKAKTTPRKLVYANSEREAPNELMARSFSDRLFLESSGTSDIRGKAHFANKSQKILSKGKEPSQPRRSRRLENWSKVKERTRREKSKTRGRRPGYQETSSDIEYEEGSEDDLNSPYKRPKPTPFTPRITRFKYHRRAKLHRNIKVYEGNKDSEDHLSIFSAAAEQEKWPIPIWCKMFRQTLGGATRNWFDDLDPKSVDSFEELSQKLLEEFS